MGLTLVQVRALKNKTNTLTTDAADLKLKLQNTKQKAERLRSNVVEVSRQLSPFLTHLERRR